MATQEAPPTAGAVRPRVRVVRRPALRRDRGSALWARLLSPGAPTRRELLAYGGLLVVLAAIVFGTHVRHGGFILDDWSNAAQSRYLANCCGPGIAPGSGAGFIAQFHVLLQSGPAAYHLGLPVLVPITQFVLGVHVHVYLMLALLFGVLMSVAAYALLRKMELAPLHAGLISALAMLFPWSDSLRLWTMASYNQVAVVLWLAGLLVALHGLRERGRRALAWHAAALGIYLVSILTYELAAGGVVISALFYLRRTNWRGALIRFVPDVAIAYAALIFVRDNTAPRPVLPLSAAIAHFNTITDQAQTLLAFVAIPFGVPARNVILALLAIAYLAGGAAWAAAPRGDAVRREMRRWLLVAGGGVVTLAGGYLTLVPANYGTPLDPGLENRVNMIAAFGYVALVYAAVMIAGTLIVRRLRRPARLAPAFAIVLALFLAAGYIHRDRADVRAYDASWAQQQRVLHAVAKTMPGGRPRDGSIIYTFGYPSFTAPGVPVFSWVWDLNPALKIYFQNPQLGGYGVLPGTTWSCGRTEMYPSSPYGTGPGEWSSYGRAWFVDVGRGVAQRIDTPAECNSATKVFQPGPLDPSGKCSLIGGGPATRLWWACSSKPRGA